MTTLLSHLRSARAFDRATSAERQAEVRRRLARVVGSALDGSRYYRDDATRAATLRGALVAASDEAFFARFAELATLQKAELATRFDDLSTDPEVTLARVIDADRAHPNGDATLRTSRGTYNIKKTSGTSGRLVYQVDTLATQRVVTSLLIYRTLFRSLRRPQDLAALVPLPRRARLVVFVHRGNRSVYQAATSQGAPRWARALLDVRVVGHDTSLDALIDELRAWQPELVFGLPSRVEWLAQAQLAGKLHLSPRLVVVGGETLHSAQRDRCIRAWPGCRVLNTYGTTETKPIAAACPECGELHLCEDIVHLELLDERGAPCEPGDEAAKVLATSLWNTTIPILRYELDDRIVLLPDAGCRWRTRRIRVRGREASSLWTRDRRDGAWRPLDGRALKEALTNLDAIMGYRVLHDAPGRLAISVVVDGNRVLDRSRAAAVEAAVRSCFAAFVETHGCSVDDVLDEVVVDVVGADAWNREGGKLQTLQSTVPAPAELDG